MKKKLTFFSMLFALISASAITSHAAELTADTADLSTFFSLITECTSAIIVTVISIILVVLAIIFRKKITKRLDNSSASMMINAFIIFFSVFGLACFAMAVATDGETWKNLLNGTDSGLDQNTHFADYLKSLQNAGSQRFYKSAESLSPFSMLIFFILAQFMPSDLISSEAYVKYIQVMKNQTFIYLYLILVLFCIVLIYRMARSKMRHNGLNMRDELVAFLLVVSYPTMYCISMGNITGVAVAFCLYFLEFYDSEKKIYRELAIIAIAIAGAIVPYSFVFAFLLLKDKSKMSKLNFAQACVFFVTLFILPAIFTGFGNMVTYVKSLLMIHGDYTPGNGSLANLLSLTGADDFILYIITAITEVIGLACFFILPATWQKSAAAVYCILNLLPNVNSLTMVFVFIPLVYLLAEKSHKAVDWLYLLAFSLLITPFPEWYHSNLNEFTIALEYIGIINLRNANELIAPIATQMIFVLIICQAAAVLKDRKKTKAGQVTEPVPEEA